MKDDARAATEEGELTIHVPVNPVRVVTATSLFDGHDASINIMRRILQAQGAEVIHLGHNRAVDDVVEAVIHEDADAVAVSSYQGGHVEYFTYLVERLAAEGRGDVGVFGGGGGVISPDEIATLAERGVRIYSPADGQRLGLPLMVNEIVRRGDAPTPPPERGVVEELLAGSAGALARVLTAVEVGVLPPALIDEVTAAAASREVPVLGITGTGGSGKSSLTDELLLRLRLDHENKLRVAVLAVDPTRRRAGGALLGDRIRMNALGGPNIFFRSLATRGAPTIPDYVDVLVAAVKAWGADVVIVETPGIGQGDSAVIDLVDHSLYVMTPEYGAASQLEKIDMLDFADVVAINKFERRGADDALREVRRQVMRNREAFGTDVEQLPVFGTIAARFNDDGVTSLYQHLRGLLGVAPGVLQPVTTKTSTAIDTLVPATQVRYLAEIAETVRSYHRHTADQVTAIGRLDAAEQTRRLLADTDADTTSVAALVEQLGGAVTADTLDVLATFDTDREHHSGDDRPTRESLSGTAVPRIALPPTDNRSELVRFLRNENLPGRFPFTAGVFPTKRDDEDPTRMFAGEGGPAKTNARFHLLAADQPATRLSTAFDSVTLYGADPAERPDIYGKVGTSGVSIAHLDDLKE